MHRHSDIPVAGALFSTFPAVARDVAKKHCKATVFLSRERVC